MTLLAMVFGVILYFLNAWLKMLRTFLCAMETQDTSANQFQAYTSALLVPLPAKFWKPLIRLNETLLKHMAICALFPKGELLFCLRKPDNDSGIHSHHLNEVWQTDRLVVSELEMVWNEHTSCCLSLTCPCARTGNWKWYLQLWLQRHAWESQELFCLWLRKTDGCLETNKWNKEQLYPTLC